MAAKRTKKKYIAGSKIKLGQFVYINAAGFVVPARGYQVSIGYRAA